MGNREGNKAMTKDEFEAYLNATTTKRTGEQPLQIKANDLTPWRNITDRATERLGAYGSWLRRERERDFILLYVNFKTAQ